jgi:hypothetical protein
MAQTIAVCRLRTILELGRPRKTMACPTANLLYSYFLDTAARTRRYCYVFSTGSTPGLFAKSMKLQIIKTEENAAEIDFSFDCNIAKGA